MSGPDALDGLPDRRRSPATTLGWVAVLETVTLAILLVNLALDGSRAVAQAVGPVHGLIYLAGIVLTWTATTDRRVRWLSIVPVAGSFFAYYLLRRE